MSLRIVVALLLLAHPVAAQPTTASAEADALFGEAKKLRAAGKLAEACAAFEASQKVSSAVSTILNLADCREENKQFASAYGWYREAERKSRAPLDEPTQELNRVAAAAAKALEARLSKLTIEVAPDRRVPQLEVVRGTDPVAEGAWGKPLPVDGGTYEITVRAPDHEPWKTTVVIAAEADFKTIAVPKLVAKARPVAKAPSKLVPIALAGGAVVLVGGALGLDLIARSQYRKAEREPDDVAQQAQWEGAKTKRFLAQGLAAAGVGAAGVAVWLYLRAGTQPEGKPGLAFQPVLADDRAGVQLQGRF